MEKDNLPLKDDEDIISEQEYRNNIIEIDTWIKDMKNFIYKINCILKKSQLTCDNCKKSNKKHLDY